MSPSNEASGKEQLDAIKRDTLTLYTNYLGRHYSHSGSINKPRFF